jgi:hypothetical protein
MAKVFDSGKRDVYETGAKRDTNEGKSRPSLLDWEFITEVEGVLLDIPNMKESIRHNRKRTINAELGYIQQMLNPNHPGHSVLEFLEPSIRRDALKTSLSFVAALVIYEELCKPEAAWWRLGEHMALGAAKYDDDNWRKGFPLGRTMDSLTRHWLQYTARADDPTDRTSPAEEDHFAAVLFNLQLMWHTIEHHPGISW